MLIRHADHVATVRTSSLLGVDNEGMTTTTSGVSPDDYNCSTSATSATWLPSVSGLRRRPPNDAACHIRTRSILDQRPLRQMSSNLNTDSCKVLLLAGGQKSQLGLSRLKREDHVQMHLSRRASDSAWRPSPNYCISKEELNRQQSVVATSLLAPAARKD